MVAFAYQINTTPCPEPGHGVHYWIMKSAHACRRAGLSTDDAVEAIVERMTRPPKWREVEDAVRKAYAEEVEVQSTYSPKPVIQYDPVHLEKLANKASHFDWDDLKERSTLDPDALTPAEYLYALYRPEEKILIFDTYNTDGQRLWTRPREDAPLDEEELDEFREPSQPNGVWFLCNPVDGFYLEIDRLVSASNPSGSSRRAEENLSSYRYFLVESDDAPQELWMRALVQLPLPIVSICTSGGRSLHALIRFDAADGDSWRKYSNEIVPELVRLGACKGTHSPAQLTRLPGCYRALKKQWQQLLFINPCADGTPICAQ